MQDPRACQQAVQLVRRLEQPSSPRCRSMPYQRRQQQSLAMYSGVGALVLHASAFAFSSRFTFASSPAPAARTSFAPSLDMKARCAGRRGGGDLAGRRARSRRVHDDEPRPLARRNFRRHRAIRARLVRVALGLRRAVGALRGARRRDVRPRLPDRCAPATWCEHRNIQSTFSLPFDDPSLPCWEDDDGADQVGTSCMPLPFEGIAPSCDGDGDDSQCTQISDGALVGGSSESTLALTTATGQVVIVDLNADGTSSFAAGGGAPLRGFGAGRVGVNSSLLVWGAAGGSTTLRSRSGAPTARSARRSRRARPSSPRSPCPTARAATISSPSPRQTLSSRSPLRRAPPPTPPTPRRRRSSPSGASPASPAR